MNWIVLNLDVVLLVGIVGTVAALVGWRLIQWWRYADE